MMPMRLHSMDPEEYIWRPSRSPGDAAKRISSPRFCERAMKREYLGEIGRKQEEEKERVVWQGLITVKQMLQAKLPTLSALKRAKNRNTAHHQKSANISLKW